MELFYKLSYHRMIDHYLPKLIQTVDMLTIQNLWQEEKGINSIGGIILHICEHIKRNTERYANPNIKYNEGIEGYFPSLDIEPNILSLKVQEVFNNWKKEFEKVITENNNIEIDAYNLFHLVEHTGYHLGQIVDRTKRITKKPFNFCQNGLNEKNLRTMIENSL
ncbi:hypothetical protein J5Y03_04900 [Bacillus sp. RG28]|uniref:DinB family protein n=1 Tax=Gottfriedia endophytica TaxID=2820819 RepID=A0A940NFI3_9BACI|nr:hypothetical protein [Gottfriedia endophytica]MBP0724524.1 hypothetical protein [Gottfriedia endophytica]